MTEDDFRNAAYPLLENGEVEILEWSFDIGWGASGIPDWASSLLEYFSENNRLLGHGVTFSALSAEETPRRKWWLENFAREMGTRNYLHVSEHFGFSSAGSFHQSAPLPVPLTTETLRVGRAHLQQLREYSAVPLGLENLAFAFGLHDVETQGEFLEKLLAPVEGFLLLDLHNIFCQSCNFQIPAEDILKSYPLDRVRELHLSGGSWSESVLPDVKKIRRDTHDEKIPDELWPVLQWALEKCPNVQAVIFERLGNTITSEAAAIQFQNDFRKLRAEVADAFPHEYSAE